METLSFTLNNPDLVIFMNKLAKETKKDINQLINDVLFQYFLNSNLFVKDVELKYKNLDPIENSSILVFEDVNNEDLNEIEIFNNGIETLEFSNILKHKSWV